MEMAIRTEGLQKLYGKMEALAPLDLEVGVGEILGYLGPNGAGKTTTIRLLLGFLRASAGKAVIFGLDAHRDTVAAHRRVGYVAGETNLWPALTGEETLHLLGRVQGRVDVAYRYELIERFAFDPSKKVRSYSKGNRQKLGLIAGLMSRADLLLLDEPTSGLDPLMQREFHQFLGGLLPMLAGGGQTPSTPLAFELATPDGSLVLEHTGDGWRPLGAPTVPDVCIVSGPVASLALFGIGRLRADNPTVSVSGPAAQRAGEFKAFFPGP